MELGGDSYAVCHSIVGGAILNQAKFRILHGVHPKDLLQQTVELSTKTLQSGSNDGPLAYSTLIDAYTTQIEFLISKRMDPSAILEKARTAQQKAATELEDIPLQLVKSEIEILAAKWQLQNGKSPENSLIDAERVASKVLQADPNNAYAYHALAEMSEIHAEWFHQQNKPIETIVNDGISNAQKALTLNPSLAETHAVAGKLHWLNSKEDQAIASLQKAIALNKNIESKYLPLINQLQNN